MSSARIWHSKILLDDHGRVAIDQNCCCCPELTLVCDSVSASVAKCGFPPCGYSIGGVAHYFKKVRGIGPCQCCGIGTPRTCFSVRTPGVCYNATNCLGDGGHWRCPDTPDCALCDSIGTETTDEVSGSSIWLHKTWRETNCSCGSVDGPEPPPGLGASNTITIDYNPSAPDASGCTNCCPVFPSYDLSFIPNVPTTCCKSVSSCSGGLVCVAGTSCRDCATGMMGVVCGALEREVTTEYTTAMLISATLAALPGYSNCFGCDTCLPYPHGEYCACQASRDLASDESSYTIQRFKYKFKFSDPPKCCTIKWLERFTPDVGAVVDTLMTEVICPGQTESAIYEVLEPSVNGATTIVYPII